MVQEKCSCGHNFCYIALQTLHPDFLDLWSVQWISLCQYSSGNDDIIPGHVRITIAVVASARRIPTQ